jgi:hypothetical protein
MDIEPLVVISPDEDPCSKAILIVQSIIDLINSASLSIMKEQDLINLIMKIKRDGEIIIPLLKEVDQELTDLYEDAGLMSDLAD